MQEDQKPKRKYRRRPKVEPLAVYNVVVTVKTGRKAETIYGESVRTEGGCLVVVSMDGPQPLVEKTRYIPLGSAEIEVCQRPAPPQYQYRPVPEQTRGQMLYSEGSGHLATITQQSGPRIVPGPLEVVRQREAMGTPIVRRPPSSEMVERNADGIAVVTAGFLDGSPT